jgi:hypothetical protein
MTRETPGAEGPPTCWLRLRRVEVGGQRRECMQRGQLGRRQRRGGRLQQLQQAAELAPAHQRLRTGAHQGLQ